jgi:tRNA-dihydrouridine synthase B
VTREAGAALLRNKSLLEDLARGVVGGARVPVTAKIRSGWDRDSSDIEHIGALLEGCGVSAIAIHARTRSEGFSGKANWSDIRRLKNAVSIPVLGNGDVRTAEDARRMFEETGCDGILIGRGAVGNPWVFREVRALFDEGREAPRPSRQEVIALAIVHLRRSVAERGLPRGLIEMRKTLAAYLRGFPRAARLRPVLLVEENLERVVEMLEIYSATLGDLAREPVTPFEAEPA